jgi:triacylglycerol esterase/lipase EstA (alpha/beta hydrolase family)
MKCPSMAPGLALALLFGAASVLFAASGPARAAVAGTGHPATGIYAPLDRPGPALTVDPATLSASLSCSGDPTTGPRPVLLVPGTTLEPAINFSWNYERGFTQAGRAWCAVSLPGNTLGDIQIAGQYVTSAIRTLSARAGRKIDLFGYSQGGMVPRYALRFWPDTRNDVLNFVAIDPSNHGTLDANVICVPLLGCAAAFWQQALGSAFLAATNSGAETFAGINYTVIFSDTDEVVVPNLTPLSSSRITTGTGLIETVPVQSICPLDVSEHLLMGTVDPVAYALTQDAFSHDGVADPARIPRSVCAQLLAPEVDPVAFPVNFLDFTAYLGNAILAAPFVPREPALAAYSYAGDD